MYINKFTLFPAIHIRNGEVVRFTQGDISQPTVFHSDPIACAQQWIDAGAEWLQVVNLDAAFDEEASHNWELIARLNQLDARLQFGGGIRSLDDVDWAMKSGIERVIIGTAAVENPQMIAQAVATWGADAIVLGIDADAKGDIKTHGWQSTANVQATAFAIQMRQLGVRNAVHTSIHRDGSLTGTDLHTSVELARSSGLRIVVGGGIGSMKDVRDCFNQQGIDGVIIGKALYTGAVDLGKALQVAERKDSFETALPGWKIEQEQPWNRFGYELIEHNLKKHIPMDSRPLHVLDAGGGNGLDSLRLARMNHRIDLVDLSRQMLDDAGARAALAGVTNRIKTHVMDVFDVAEEFGERQFDIVLCHNVMQFIDDYKPLLETLYRVLKPGGFLSLVTTNQYSLPYQAAFLEHDLDKAYELLELEDQKHPVFDIEAHEFHPDDVTAWLAEIGFKIEKHYGIRCLYNYWGTNELKEDSGIYKQLRKIEMELTGRHPYNLTARQFQLIARR